MSSSSFVREMPLKRVSVSKPSTVSAGKHSALAMGDFTMAFQPIVDLEKREVFAYEALLRGREQQLAQELLGKVDRKHLYAFDHSCHIKAIEMATALGMVQSGVSLSINLMPGALTPSPNSAQKAIRGTLDAAAAAGLPLKQIIFELTEQERVSEGVHLRSIFKEYREHGLRLAIDDFGAGYAGLTLLADFQPDLVKIDRALIHDIDRNKPARSIVGAIVDICRSIGIVVVAEGVERAPEAAVLQDLGVPYMQGYLFARPAFEALAEPLYEAMSA